MKKILQSIVLVLFLFSSFITPVHADMGPKPSVTIHFEGIDEEYYVTLLSKFDGYGPWQKQDEFDSEGAVRKSIWEKFNNYEDEYYFIGYFEECTKSHDFHWSYYPPESFKVLIYFAESDSFLESEILERYSFNSTFTITIDNNEMIIKNNYNYTKEITSFLTRIVITVVLELFIAYIFSLTRFLKVIIPANIFTQVLLNIGLNINGHLFIYMLLEIFIILIEGFIYQKYMDQSIKHSKIWSYSVFANITSLILGFFISMTLRLI